MNIFLKFKLLPFILLSFVVFTSCEDDSGISSVILNETASPSNLDASLNILEGNMRALEVIPSGDGVTSFNIFFGENPNEIPVSIGIMSSATHVYENAGTYIVEIQGVSPNNVTNSILFSVDIEF